METLLQHWVTRQAECRPESIAVVFNRERLTYSQLEEASNRLARLLRDRGCRRGDRICFLMPRSPVAIVTLLGILKADCIHVPLDPSSPAPRLSKILDSCEPRWLLAAGPVTGLLEGLFSNERFRRSIHLGWMEEGAVAGTNFRWEFSQGDMASYSGSPPDFQNRPEDPAHIVFTSGSTGVPKGVLTTHSNVIHFVDWGVRYFGIGPLDRVSAHSPLHFDLSMFDMFGAFGAGAQLHQVPPELSLMPHKLAAFIRDSELTQWLSVPSLLHYMAKFDVVRFHDFPSLRRLLWCGEVFPTPGLIYWMKRLPHATFTNLYGPTEATIASSYYQVPRCPESDREPIPIGTPCPGEELLILDEKLQAVPAGIVGDLYIRGVGLSRGYWQDPEKTSAAFLSLPRDNGPSDRIYKTGDLAKVGEDGLFYFLGRADSQIKSRGYRIEPGEIEAALSALEGLQQCAVVAIPTEGFEGQAICCAYSQLPGASVTPAELQEQLNRLLPSHMLPAHWMLLDQMPANASGKIDRKKLQELFQMREVECQAKEIR
jgi:amino acid adenylation domain-containing protein